LEESGRGPKTEPEVVDDSLNEDHAIGKAVEG